MPAPGGGGVALKSSSSDDDDDVDFFLSSPLLSEYAKAAAPAVPAARRRTSTGTDGCSCHDEDDDDDEGRGVGVDAAPPPPPPTLFAEGGFTAPGFGIGAALISSTTLGWVRTYPLVPDPCLSVDAAPSPPPPPTLFAKGGFVGFTGFGIGAALASSTTLGWVRTYPLVPDPCLA